LSSPFSLVLNPDAIVKSCSAKREDAFPKDVRR